MENSVEMVENVAEVGNGNFVKTAAIVLGVGAVIGIVFGIKKVVEKRKMIKLTAQEPQKEVPENNVQ